MQCPRCGFEQPPTDECISCGVIISKYKAGPAPAQPQPAAQEPAEPLPGLDAEAFAPLGDGGAVWDGPVQSETPLDSPFTGPATDSVELAGVPMPGGSGDLGGGSLGGGGLDAQSLAPAPSSAPAGIRPAAVDSSGFTFQFGADSAEPIGPAAMALRTVAAFACLGIAVLMVANGSSLLSIAPFAVMTFYGVAAIWGLTTFRNDVTLKQFAIEMAVLVFLTLGMRVAQPQVFSISTEESEQETIVTPVLPNTPSGRFTADVVAFTDAFKQLLATEGSMPLAAWEGLSSALDHEALRRQQLLLSDGEKAEVDMAWRRVKDLGDTVERLLEQYVSTAGEVATITIPPLEREALLEEASKADGYARALRERLLIYPSAARSVSPTDFE